MPNCGSLNIDNSMNTTLDIRFEEEVNNISDLDFICEKSDLQISDTPVKHISNYKDKLKNTQLIIKKDEFTSTSDLNNFIKSMNKFNVDADISNHSDSIPIESKMYNYETNMNNKLELPSKNNYQQNLSIISEGIEDSFSNSTREPFNELFLDNKNLNKQPCKIKTPLNFNSKSASNECPNCKFKLNFCKNLNRSFPSYDARIELVNKTVKEVEINPKIKTKEHETENHLIDFKLHVSSSTRNLISTTEQSTLCDDEYFKNEMKNTGINTSLYFSDFFTDTRDIPLYRFDICTSTNDLIEKRDNETEPFRIDVEMADVSVNTNLILTCDQIIETTDIPTNLLHFGCNTDFIFNDKSTSCHDFKIDTVDMGVNTFKSEKINVETDMFNIPTNTHNFSSCTGDLIVTKNESINVSILNIIETANVMVNRSILSLVDFETDTDGIPSNTIDIDCSTNDLVIRTDESTSIDNKIAFQNLIEASTNTSNIYRVERNTDTIDIPTNSIHIALCTDDLIVTKNEYTFTSNMIDKTDIGINTATVANIGKGVGTHDILQLSHSTLSTRDTSNEICDSICKTLITCVEFALNQDVDNSLILKGKNTVSIFNKTQDNINILDSSESFNVAINNVCTYLVDTVVFSLRDAESNVPEICTSLCNHLVLSVELIIKMEKINLSNIYKEYNKEKIEKLWINASVDTMSDDFKSCYESMNDYILDLGDLDSTQSNHSNYSYKSFQSSHIYETFNYDNRINEIDNEICDQCDLVQNWPIPSKNMDESIHSNIEEQNYITKELQNETLSTPNKSFIKVCKYNKVHLPKERQNFNIKKTNDYDIVDSFLLIEKPMIYNKFSILDHSLISSVASESFMNNTNFTENFGQNNNVSSHINTLETAKINFESDNKDIPSNGVHVSSSTSDLVTLEKEIEPYDIPTIK
ncbi:hypothetical protein A3Q56_08093, partial [Intoshia linei]